MSTQITSLPKSATPAPATSPTYPVPRTAKRMRGAYQIARARGSVGPASARQDMRCQRKTVGQGRLGGRLRHAFLGALQLEMDIALEQPAQGPVRSHDRPFQRWAAVDPAEGHAQGAHREAERERLQLRVIGGRLATQE